MPDTSHDSSKRRFTPAGTAALWLGLVGVILAITVFIKSAPMQLVQIDCTLCGRLKTEKWIAGIRYSAFDRPSPCADWVDAVAAHPHDHLWSSYPDLQRTSWFGPQMCTCGASSPVWEIYHARAKIGEAQAIEALNKWQQLVQSATYAEANPREQYEFIKAFLKESGVRTE